jgi:hypothetical protein
MRQLLEYPSEHGTAARADLFAARAGRKCGAWLIGATW